MSTRRAKENGHSHTCVATVGLKSFFKRNPIRRNNVSRLSSMLMRFYLDSLDENISLVDGSAFTSSLVD